VRQLTRTTTVKSEGETSEDGRKEMDCFVRLFFTPGLPTKVLEHAGEILKEGDVRLPTNGLLKIATE